MLLDYHLHTPLCNHATGEPEAYADRALALGIPEIGFSDHAPMPPDYDPLWRMRPDQFSTYAGMIRRVQRSRPELGIKFGLEADFHPGTEEFVRQFLGLHEFDYVIGSVHYLGDWGFDHPDHQERFRKTGLYEIYRQYFDLLRRLAQTGMYDIVGHPDVIKKFGYRPDRAYDDLLRTALEAVAQAGMAVEVNTSGLRYPCREIYPSRRMLEIAREMEIPVTLGSDAHRPEHVGEDFDQAVALLKSLGYGSIQRFTGRRAEPVTIG